MPDALQEDAPQDHQEIAQRNQIRQRLNPRRHVLDREDESRQIHHRHEEEEDRRHHRLLLRLRDGGDKQAEAKRGEQVDHAHAEQQRDAAPHRHFKPVDRDNQHEHDVENPDQRVRQHLAGDELPARQRRDVELLERADFLLAHDRHRRQVGGDHQQKEREDAGDHEVAADQPRIEPDANLRLNQSAHRQSRRGGPRAILDVSGNHGLGVTHRHTGGVGVGAVGHDLQRRLLTRLNLPSIVRRNAERHPGLAAIEIAIDLAGRTRHADDLEIIRGLEPVDQLAAGRRPIGIDDDDGDVFDVGGGRIAEHRQLHDRRDDHDAEQARIPLELQQFLPHQVKDAFHVPICAFCVICGPIPCGAESMPGRAPPWQRSRAPPCPARTP